MLTLATHNQARLETLEARRARPGCAGVRCDACHAPMLYASHTKLAEPPAVSVKCSACEAAGLLYL